MTSHGTDPRLADIAAMLRDAEASRQPVAPLTAQFPDLTAAEAYQVQQLNVRHRTNAGGIVRGHKVGLTSTAMQRQLGVEEPDFGVLFSDMLVEEGDPISVSDMVSPRVEAEIAFVMERDLKGPGVTAVDAMRAVAGALPSIEVIDSRIVNWQIKLPDTIADNASCARVVSPGRLTPLAGLDLRTIGMVLTMNGEVVETGAGAAVLGNPIRCVAWLANTLGSFDTGLKEGDLVLAGALHASLPVTVGTTVHAEFAHLGSVTTVFVA